MGGVVTTIGERCKRCYTCVRHCPAKAIKVQDGQAKVLPERCIACGNCIRVCSQNAKRVESDDLAAAQRMVGAGDHVVACFAPSFPAAFPDVRPRQVATAARRLGFAEVVEVAVGAELVARACRRFLAEDGRQGPLITTPCPAVVSYVEMYLPELVPKLMPVVSPMIALGRLIKGRLRSDAKVVFIGPCLAKKTEARDPNLAGAVDAVLTSREFSDWAASAGADMTSLPEGEFDGPHPSVGRIFPVPGGLLRTAAVQADVLDNEIIVTEGVDRTTELLRELAQSTTRARFFDLLFCEGCIAGPFAESNGNMIALKQKVVDYAREAMTRAPAAWVEEYDDLDLTRAFTDAHIEAPEPSEEDIQAILRQTNKLKPEDELDCGACGYPSCREKAIAVYQGLAEAEMCLPYLIEQLERTVAELNVSRRELVEAEEQLIHSEKLASMGQLAAGVAHEINNPLGTVLLYAHTLLNEMPQQTPHRADLEMIAQEADRCRHIVRGLLDFSRQSKLQDELTYVNDLLRDTLLLLEKQGDFAKVEVIAQLDPGLPKAMVDPEQMRQALINILENAAEAMAGGGQLTVSTELAPEGRSLSIRVTDTGRGIPEENLERVFHPFFTTKQIGRGTGLGLAIVYGIVKTHHGSISVDSKVGAGTTFTISLPVPDSREAREQR